CQDLPPQLYISRAHSPPSYFSTLSLHDALPICSSRSSYFATFRHQLTILSKTDALDEEKWLNMLGTFVKDWFRYESHFVHPTRRSEERFSRNAETDIVCRLLLEKKTTRDPLAVE